MKMQQIELLSKHHADALRALDERVLSVNEELRLIKRRHLRNIKSSASYVAETADKLKQAIADCRGLFSRPKTRIFHGLRVGYIKQKPMVVYDNVAVCDAIELNLKSKRKALIQYKMNPIKSAIGKLNDDELEIIGAIRICGDEEIIIKRVDSSVNKMVDALLADIMKESDYERS